MINYTYESNESGRKHKKQLSFHRFRPAVNSFSNL